MKQLILCLGLMIFSVFTFANTKFDALNDFFERVDATNGPNLFQKGAYGLNEQERIILNEIIESKHANSPFKKLRSFRNARNTIEKSIKQNPDNNWFRLVRLSLQLNVPDFLNYNDDIQTDYALLKQDDQYAELAYDLMQYAK